MGRLYDAFQRVAHHAAKQIDLLLVVARHAGEPFRIGELGRDVAGTAEFHVDGCGGVGGDCGGFRPVKFVADRADAQAILAGFELRGREGEAAVTVTRYRDGNRRAVFLCADEYAFHRAFFRRRDLAGQRARRGRRLRERIRPAFQQQGRETDQQ